MPVDPSSSRIGKRRSEPTGSGYLFGVKHPAKQRILLAALRSYEPPDETPEETQAIVEMEQQLERLLRMRKRVRRLGKRKVGGIHL